MHARRALPALAAWERALPSDARRGLLDASARAIFGGSRNPSFWVSPGHEARTWFDRFALDVFWFHASRLGLSRRDVAKLGHGAGAEYWVQRRTMSQPRAQRGMDWHFDKDEDLLDEDDVTVTPAVSTVTYLTGAGWPLMVLSEPSLAQGQADAVLAPLSEEDVQLFVVFPTPGLHVAFRGDLYHGCPLELGGACSGERLSLVANVWLGHRPMGTSGSLGSGGAVSALPSALRGGAQRALAPAAEAEPTSVDASGAELRVEFGPWQVSGLRLPRELATNNPGAQGDADAARSVWAVRHPAGEVSVDLHGRECRPQPPRRKPLRRGPPRPRATRTRS